MVWVFGAFAPAGRRIDDHGLAVGTRDDDTPQNRLEVQWRSFERSRDFRRIVKLAGLGKQVLGGNNGKLRLTAVLGLLERRQPALQRRFLSIRHNLGNVIGDFKALDGADESPAKQSRAQKQHQIDWQSIFWP